MSKATGIKPVIKITLGCSPPIGSLNKRLRIMFYVGLSNMKVESPPLLLLG